jgi:hypothetical protein
MKRPELLGRTICPHCWTAFAPEDVLWVSSHEDLRGDARLGPDEPLRFVPTRFNVEGNALDARGFVCQVLACPNCHLTVPRALLEMEPTFISVLGSPGCGKSFFLAAMTWELRRLLPRFALSFGDADTEANILVKQYENALFLNPRADEVQPLQNLIRKTEEVGTELYRTVRYGNQLVAYPRPFLFAVRSRKHHPWLATGRAGGCVVCLYDNAGESFEVGKDSTGSPATRHLAKAQLLLFLFDPLQDVRFRRQIQARLPDTRLLDDHPSYRQEDVLQEVAARVRRALSLPHGARHDRPLIVVCTKLDAWAHLLKDGDVAHPWAPVGQTTGLRLGAIQARSLAVRELLLRVCPEVVNLAEDFTNEVSYVPVSALGSRPVVGEAGKGAIRPADIRPCWVEIPLLSGLHRRFPGLVPCLKREAPPGGDPPDGPARPS